MTRAIKFTFYEKNPPALCEHVVPIHESNEKKISELTSLTENSLIFHIVFSRLQVALETNDGIELLRFDRPLRCMECPCDSCYPDMTQVIQSYS